MNLSLKSMLEMVSFQRSCVTDLFQDILVNMSSLKRLSDRQEKVNRSIILIPGEGGGRNLWIILKTMFLNLLFSKL